MRGCAVATNPLFYDADYIAMVNAYMARANGGFLVIYTGTQPALNGALTGTLLVTLGLSATAFATATASASTVTAAANSISNGTAVATGTAGYHAVLKSDATTVVWTGTVATSGADLNMSSLNVITGAIISCSAYSYSIPQT